MNPSPPGAAHHPHGHRTWLHLIPEDRELVPARERLRAAAELLLRLEVAAGDPGAGSLAAGPAFGRVLAPSRSLPMAGPPRGEVRIEAGILRCYPDPGPDGFDTEPVRSYRTRCPGCNVPIEFFALRFPFPDPMRAACPGCGAALDVSELTWDPWLPVARAEITFGDLVGRPSLRGSELLKGLERSWETRLLEVHVTL